MTKEATQATILSLAFSAHLGGAATLSITTFSIAALRIFVTQYNTKAIMLSVIGLDVMFYQLLS